MKMTTKSAGLALLATGLVSFLPLSLLAQESKPASVNVSADVATPAPVIVVLRLQRRLSSCRTAWRMS